MSTKSEILEYLESISEYAEQIMNEIPHPAGSQSELEIAVITIQAGIADLTEYVDSNL
jgi:uncharacterized alkaline shock family protein YloU